MKKTIFILLAGILACGILAGCSSSGISQEEYEQVLSELESAQQELDAYQSTPDSQSPADDSHADNSSSAASSDVSESSPEVPEQTLVEDKGIKITFTGLEINEYGDAELKLQVENNSGQAITVQTRNESINGIMVSGTMSCHVISGKIANDSLSFFATRLEENNITEIHDVEFSFYIFDSDTYQDILTSDIISLSF